MLIAKPFKAVLFVLLKHFSDAIMEFSGGVLTVYGPNETASIFATYPSEYISLGRSFLDQVSLTLDWCRV